MKRIVAITGLAFALALGCMAVQAVAEAGKEEVKVCRISAADLDSAIKALESAKAAIPDDKKEAKDGLDKAIKLLAAARTTATTSQPTSAAVVTPPVVSAGAKSFTGEVESTRSEKRPRLVVDGTHYELQAAENAGAAVRDMLAKISSGDVTGKVTVKGTTGTVKGKSGILVESITKD